MNERFVQFLWRFGLFEKELLKTSAGEVVEVMDAGQWNDHAGPDFLHARVRIGGTLWCGHVEIHIRASDWIRHGHPEDPRYQQVILHVVWENDVAVSLKSPGDLHVAELRAITPERYWQTCREWMESTAWIPCSGRLKSIAPLDWSAWKDRLVAERLEKRTRVVEEFLRRLSGDWNEVFYRLLARNFGFRLNADAFESLAAGLPSVLLGRHQHAPQEVEALLFGQSGLLPLTAGDSYTAALMRDYAFFRHKYRLNPLPPGVWNTGRVRPANRPEMRIAEFAALMVHRPDRLWDVVAGCDDADSIVGLFRVQVSPYWQTHYRFGDPGAEREIRHGRNGWLTKDTAVNLILNTVIPVLAAWGKYHGQPGVVDKAWKLYVTCSAEDNAVIRNWRREGVEVEHAGDSQALLELYHGYCEARRCLDCNLGLGLMKRL